jgi:hypothetical protein
VEPKSAPDILSLKANVLRRNETTQRMLPEDKPMGQKSLRERLAQLHAELAKAHQQDPATRESLGEILPDVKRMLDQPADAAAPSVDKSLPGRLERVAVQFEAEHPTLAASARRLIDLLNEVGI